MQLGAAEPQGQSAHPLDSRVRDQLERILASEIFTRSERLSAFLRYVVEQTLDRQGSVLKEQVLGIELYGKGQAFDSTADPIVRVDARRLRDKLREYYAECPRDPILISVPKGSYVPSFEENQNNNPANPPAQPYVVHVSRRMRWSWLATAVVLTSVIAAGVCWSLLLRSANPADRGVLITTSGVSPGISPDGRFITFSGRGTAEDTTADIWVKAIEGGTLRRLTSTPEFRETFPSWSPDSREIAFMRENQGIFVTPISGGTERRVSSGTWADWAPDGKSLIVRDCEREGPFGMYQVFPETRERRRLTQPLLGDGDWRAAVSPDGSTLAFARHEPSNGGDLYIVPMQGGEPRRVTNWNARLTGVVWTPDGRDLIYSHEGLWRISANLTAPGRGSRLEGVSAEVNNFAISRPSYGQPARIVYQAYHRRLSFQVIDLAAPTSEGVFRRAKPFPVSTQFESPGPFSPDDRRFAFVSGRPPQVRVSVSDTDDGGVRQIASLDKPPWLGSWSHDGGKIVYSASINGNSDIFVLDTNRGSSRRLTFESSEESFPSYSRNGRWIYFSSTVAGALDIWRIPAEGGLAVRITYHGGVQAREAPDGYLYYVDRYPPNERMMRPYGTSRLMRVPANGGGLEMEVLKGLTAYWWSMADSGIFYISHESGFKGVDFIDFIDHYSFSDRKVKRIGRLATRAAQINPQMQVSSDGRWALVSTQVVYTNLMLIDNIR